MTVDFINDMISRHTFYVHVGMKRSHRNESMMQDAGTVTEMWSNNNTRDLTCTPLQELSQSCGSCCIKAHLTAG